MAIYGTCGCAYIYALHKHRNNPLIQEDWYLAEIMGEITRQNHFSMHCVLDMRKKQRIVKNIKEKEPYVCTT